MSDSNDSFIFKIILIGGLIFAIVKAVEVIADAFATLLTGLVIIALIVAGIVALRWLHHYLTNPQYGQSKRMRQVHTLEQQKLAYMAQAPKHVKPDIEAYFNKQQADLFAIKPTSRLDDFLEVAKQVFSTFQRRGK